MQCAYAIVKYVGGGVQELLGDRHNMRTPFGVRVAGEMVTDVQLMLPVEPGSNLYRMTDQVFPLPGDAVRRVVELEQVQPQRRRMSTRRGSSGSSMWSKRFTISSAEKQCVLNSLSN